MNAYLKQVLTCTAVACLLLVVIITPVITPVAAQASGNWPEKGDFNGMSMHYTISGVTVNNTTDTFGELEKRTLTGKVDPGGKVHVDATFSIDGGYHTDCYVSVSGADSKTAHTERYDADGKPHPQSVSLSVDAPVAQNATHVSVVIGMDTSYEMGDRALKVSGTFESSGTGGGDGFPLNPAAALSAAAAAIGAATAVVVVGGLGAVAAAAGTMADSRKKDDDDDDQGPIGYILQITKDQLLVAPGQPDSFDAAVYEVNSDGGYKIAVGASMSVGSGGGVAVSPDGTIDAPTGAGLIVNPSVGQGQMSVQVRIEGTVQPGEVPLKVTASAAGTTQEATVMVSIEGKYSLKCEPKGKESPFLIHWHKVEWVCDPVTVTVLVDGKVRNDVEISEIRMSDEKRWLKLASMKKTHESEYTIRLKIEPESGAAIAPQTGEELEVQDYSQRDESSLKERPPATPLFSLMTFTASISSKLPLKPGADATKAAISAAGLIPLPDSAIPSPDLNLAEASGECYAIVEPPLFTWTISQQDPVRISGEPGKSVMNVRAEDVPRGWDRGTVVGFCFGEPEFREKSGLRLQPKIEPPSSRSSDPFFQIACALEVESTILGLKQAEEVMDPPVPESEPFKVVTEGEMIGRAVQILNVNVQPCPVSLYLDTFSESSYPWNDEKYKIQARKVAEAATTDWSKLPVSIRYPKGWIEPPVKWILKNEELEEYEGYDDRFTHSSGLQSTYIAPSQETWAGSEDGIGSPQRPVRCVIGQSPKNGKQPVPMDAQRGIFSTLHIDAEFTIRKPLGNVTVHITVKPDGFPASPEEMNLVDGKIYESIVRTFCIEIDLQKLPVYGREEK